LRSLSRNRAIRQRREVPRERKGRTKIDHDVITTTRIIGGPLNITTMKRATVTSAHGTREMKMTMNGGKSGTSIDLGMMTTSLPRYLRGQREGGPQSATKQLN
jgi:hypothetical protein